jgi:hypothetical protein
MQMFLSELQKQAKGVPLGTNSVRTRLPLIHQPLVKKFSGNAASVALDFMIVSPNNLRTA